MPRNLLLFVTEDTWTEHSAVGIAAINDPGHAGLGGQANSSRQKAIAEIAGVRPGDRLFFRIGRSDRSPARIQGGFVATSEPYFDPSPLFPGAVHVGESLSIRVEFRCAENFLAPFEIEHLWLAKERGRIWTIQQTRGDVMGRHACVSISNDEAATITNLLRSNNPIIAGPIDYHQLRLERGLTAIAKQPLPIDLRLSEAAGRTGRFHYEAAMQSVLLRELFEGRHAQQLGQFTEALSFVSTGAQTELDVLLLKHEQSELVWHQIVELKAHTFSEAELKKVIDYEKWILNTRSDNVLQVHSVGIGYQFDDQVVEFVRGRKRYGDRPIRLLAYRYNVELDQIELEAAD